MRRGLRGAFLALAATLAVALVLICSCTREGRRAAHGASVVAMVGERPVGFSEFATYVKDAAGDEVKAVSPQVASSLLDQLVEERLLDRAVEDAQPRPPGARPDERRRALIAREAALSAITDSDLRKEYAARPELFRRSGEVRVSQMLFANVAQAQGALRRLEKGEGWLEVSRAESKAPNAATGGTLGVLGRGDLPREFEEAVFRLKPGATTAPIVTPHGVHVFRVEERLDGRTVPFEEASAGLRLKLAGERSEEAVARLLAKSRAAHPAAVVEEHLPFPYVGSLPRWVDQGR